MKFPSKITKHTAMTLIIAFLMLLTVAGAALAANVLTSIYHYNITGAELLQALETTPDTEPGSYSAAPIDVYCNDIAQGASATKYTWVKNNSGTSIDVAFSSGTPTSTGVTVSASPSTFTLAAGASRRVAVTVSADSMATVTSGTVTIDFDEAP